MLATPLLALASLFLTAASHVAVPASVTVVDDVRIDALATRTTATAIGTGSTSSAAYKNAKDQMPSGVSHHRKDQRKRSDGTYKVTLHYDVR